MIFTIFSVYSLTPIYGTITQNFIKIGTALNKMLYIQFYMLRMRKDRKTTL